MFVKREKSHILIYCDLLSGKDGFFIEKFIFSKDKCLYEQLYCWNIYYGRKDVNDFSKSELFH